MVKEKNSDPKSGIFSYISIVGMLIYLYGNTCIFVALAMSSFAQYTLSYKLSHEFSLKTFAGYLNHTKDRGLVLDTNYDVYKVDAYPDEIFLVCMNTRSLLILHVL